MEPGRARHVGLMSLGGFEFVRRCVVSDIALDANTATYPHAHRARLAHGKGLLIRMFSWAAGIALRLMMVFVVFALVRSPPGELREWRISLAADSG